MAITLVGSNKVITGGNTLDTASGGITVAANDIVVAAAFTDGHTAMSLTGFGLHGDSTAAVGSWTTIYDTPNIAATPKIMMGWSRASSSGIVRPTISRAVGWNNGQAVCFVLRGADTISGKSAVANGTSTSPASAAVTPTKAGDWVVGVFGGRRGTGTWTNTATWTDIISDAAPYADTGWVNFGVERKEAANTTPFAGAPTLDTPDDTWTAFSFVVEMTPEVVPGTTVARGLYL